MRAICYLYIFIVLISIFLPVCLDAGLKYREIKISFTRYVYPSYTIQVVKGQGRMVGNKPTPNFLIVRRYDSRGSLDSGDRDEGELIKISDEQFDDLSRMVNEIHFFSLLQSYPEDYSSIHGDSLNIECIGKGFSFVFRLHNPMIRDPDGSLSALFKAFDELVEMEIVTTPYKGPRDTETRGGG